MTDSKPVSRGKRSLILAGLVVIIGGSVLLAVNLQSDAPDPKPETGEADPALPPLDPAVAAALKANELSDEKQKHIWSVEHATFELETVLGKAFRKALAARDGSALAEFLVDEVQASVLPSGNENQRTVGPLTEFQATAGEVLPTTTDSSGLIQSLLESIRPLKELERTRFRILALDTKGDDVWESEILLECVGVDSEDRHTLVSSHHEVEFTFSSDDEIRQGRIISAWRDKDRSRRTSPGRFLEEVTEATGLAALPIPDNWNLDHKQVQRLCFQMAVEDFNRDGFPDIAIGSVLGRPLLLKSDRCRNFEDVTQDLLWITQPVGHLNLATWIDFDDDGWPDLLLGDRLYRNREGKQFDDVTQQSGLKFGYLPMGAAVADYDCDGLPDLYVLYQMEADAPLLNQPEPWVGDHENGVRNQLWKNEGGGRFRDVTAKANASGGKRMSYAATWHFLDDDRFPDLYIANDFGENVHLKNRGDGTFEDVSSKTGTADFATTMGACSGDLNNDGRPEIYAANMFSKMGRRIIRHVGSEDYTEGIFRQIQGSCAGNRLYTTAADSLKFRETSELAGVNQVGWAYAPAMADFNSDGLLDIYAATGFMSFDRKKPDG